MIQHYFISFNSIFILISLCYKQIIGNDKKLALQNQKFNGINNLKLFFE